ncbi:5-oxoprolinase subunit B family protein [Fretibacterium fastidiosum]|uniref:Allophanate hydrolase subunit 1 n=1 Tax=Fretibacterium fastidiosum TaxID=651822 RepID=A0AB94IW61_9BACT|nr:allophanate hydrolase subunit 1 [Fretibacterium fastidiosum]CBL27959.1 Allophanate hydrolase subunit 1 [Fretibacterium fastidiosum]
MQDVAIKQAGDSAVLVEFENEIGIETNAKVRSLMFSLERRPFAGMRELTPAYRSLLIQYDPCAVKSGAVREFVGQSLANLRSVTLPKPVITEIPVIYDPEFAPDIEEIARIEDKTVEEVIRIHSGSDYFVYMLGFAPGHPYTARFENPFSFKRRESPRVRIDGGSVVVQLALSNIIPFDQPCGWNIIGTTPVLVCDYRRENPFLLKAGQWIRHIPIDRDEYFDIKRRVELSEYVCRTYEKEGTP